MKRKKSTKPKKFGYMVVVSKITTERKEIYAQANGQKEARLKGLKEAPYIQWGGEDNGICDVQYKVYVPKVRHH